MDKKLELKLEKRDLELAKKETEVYKNWRILAYEPASEKHKSFHMSPKPIRGMFGGVKSGKSFLGVVEVVFHATGLYPDWYPEECKMKQPTKQKIVVTEYKRGGKEDIDPKLKIWLPQSYIDPKKTKNHPVYGFPVDYTLTNGSTINIMSSEEDVKNFEGWDSQGVMINEPVDMERWQEILRGALVLGGRIWLCMTLIREGWIYDAIYDNKSEDIFTITVAQVENKFLDKEFRERYERNVDPIQREARLLGIPQFLIGLVYKNFQHDVHVIPRHNPPSGATIYHALDPHDREKHALGWAYVNNTTTQVGDKSKGEKTVTIQPGDLVFYDDAELTPTSVDDLVNFIKAKEGHRTTFRRIIDPNKGRTPQVTSGTTLAEELVLPPRKLYYFDQINDNIHDRHRIVGSLLEYDRGKPIDAINHPKLYITENCKNIIKGFLRYCWDEKSSREKPKDDYKHFPDVVGYIAMDNPRYVEPYNQTRSITTNQIQGRSGY